MSLSTVDYEHAKANLSDGIILDGPKGSPCYTAWMVKFDEEPNLYFGFSTKAGGQRQAILDYLEANGLPEPKNTVLLWMAMNKPSPL